MKPTVLIKSSKDWVEIKVKGEWVYKGSEINLNALKEVLAALKTTYKAIPTDFDEEYIKDWNLE